MYSSTNDSLYKSRDNGFPYDERDYMRYSRSHQPPPIDTRRDYPRDGRDERDRDLRYRSQKRDWGSMDMSGRDYGGNSGGGGLSRQGSSGYLRGDDITSPTNKRRKLDMEDIYSTKDYKRGYDYSYRNNSRSPSPSTASDYRGYGGGIRSEDKGYRDPYYERDPYKSPAHYSRDRDGDYGRYYNRDYSRGGSSMGGSSVRSWERKYDAYDNGPRRDYSDEPHRRNSSYEKYDRGDYDRRDRYRDDDYSKDYYDRDRGHSREPDYGSYYKEKDRDSRFYDPYSPLRDDIRKDSPEEGEELGDRERRYNVDVPPAPKEEQSPTPKRRLGWGQGLVAFERSKNLEDERSPKSPAPGRTEDKETSGAAMDISPIKHQEPHYRDIPQGQLPKLEHSLPMALERNQISPRADSSRPRDPRVRLEPLETKYQEPQPSEVKRIDSSQDLTEQKMDIKEEVKEEVEEPPSCPFPAFPHKEEVLAAIERIDAEITKTEQLIAKLNKPKRPEHKQAVGQSLVETILLENQEKAKSAQEEFFNSLLKAPKFEGPVFKQISDYPQYQENLKKHESIKQEIAAVVWKRRQDVIKKEEKLKSRYKQLYEKWKAKVQKLEAKRRKKEMKQKKKKDDSFEDEPQQIRRPILRSQSLRTAVSMSRGGTPRNSEYVRSEVEFDAILRQLREEDDCDPNSKYLKTVATVPPMIRKELKIPEHVDNSGLVLDPLAVEKERKLRNPWTEKEKAIFMKKFLTYGKLFGKIASYLENKTVQDVVWYYYANKKTLDLKRLLQEQQAKKRGYGRRTPIRFTEFLTNLTICSSVGSTGSTTPTTPTAPGVPRELANLGVTSANSGLWPYEPRNKSRAAARNVNYNENAGQAEERPPKSQSGSGDTDNTRWTGSERDSFIAAFTKYGKEWKLIANDVGTKNQFQCKNYYHNMKKKLNLDQILMNRNAPAAGKQDEEKEKPKENKRTVTAWSEEQKGLFLKNLQIYGKDWKKLATLIPGKSMYQIKTYFQNHKIDQNLERLLPEDYEGKEVGRKRSRNKLAAEKRAAAKKRIKESKDSDSSAVPSPVLPGTSPVVSEPPVDPFTDPPQPDMESVASLLEFANTVTSLAEREQSLKLQAQESATTTSTTTTSTPSHDAPTPAPPAVSDSTTESKTEETEGSRSGRPTDMETEEPEGAFEEVDADSDAFREEEMTESGWDEKDEEEFEEVEMCSPEPVEEPKIGTSDLASSVDETKELPVPARDPLERCADNLDNTSIETQSDIPLELLSGIRVATSMEPAPPSSVELPSSDVQPAPSEPVPDAVPEPEKPQDPQKPSEEPAQPTEPAEETNSPALDVEEQKAEPTQEGVEPLKVETEAPPQTVEQQHQEAHEDAEEDVPSDQPAQLDQPTEESSADQLGEPVQPTGESSLEQPAQPTEDSSSSDQPTQLAQPTEDTFSDQATQPAEESSSDQLVQPAQSDEETSPQPPQLAQPTEESSSDQPAQPTEESSMPEQQVVEEDTPAESSAPMEAVATEQEGEEDAMEIEHPPEEFQTTTEAEHADSNAAPLSESPTSGTDVPATKPDISNDEGSETARMEIDDPPVESHPSGDLNGIVPSEAKV